VRYRFYTCDVFTRERFGGNPLAVLPEAEGLSDRRMQQIAREFNFSETSFVFPPQSGHTRRVRIFTPGREVPFAGHPNVGTAFVLASHGELGDLGSTRSVSPVAFEEKAGLVPIAVHSSGGRVTSCELSAPEPLSVGRTVDVSLVAEALSLAVADVVVSNHAPCLASAGLAFLMVELRDPGALERARANLAGFEAIQRVEVRPSIYLYVSTPDGDGGSLRSRMFAPMSGVPEDPATGSAACAVAGLLAHLRPEPTGSFAFRISQGVEMGRPSSLAARAEKRDGTVTSTGVGGECVLISEGSIEVG
jgi:trans-2,3-dihydro-3-hydroxyanthranilate isomerase